MLLRGGLGGRHSDDVLHEVIVESVEVQGCGHDHHLERERAVRAKHTDQQQQELDLLRGLVHLVDEEVGAPLPVGLTALRSAHVSQPMEVVQHEVQEVPCRHVDESALLSDSLVPTQAVANFLGDTPALLDALPAHILGEALGREAAGLQLPHEVRGFLVHHELRDACALTHSRRSFNEANIVLGNPRQDLCLPQVQRVAHVHQYLPWATCHPAGLGRLHSTWSRG
mmetsp:Transcript_43292/g.139115  ORF Transcript_43292/g.139115 Transcript_43292/m.139115 type:complete len:226 (+) Transcript_43292:3567-4244(+)